MGQPSDPKRTPRGRPTIESWLAERLSRTLGENPDDDLDDIDEIVPVDSVDDTGPQAYNLYDDEADTTRRRIAVVGGAPEVARPPEARRPARPVGYPVAGNRFTVNGAPSHLLDPDGFVTTPSIDAPLPSEEAPTVVADGVVADAVVADAVVADGPRFEGQDPFEIREPGPGEVTNPVPPDLPGPDEWDLLGDPTVATVVDDDASPDAAFSGEETPTVASIGEGDEPDAALLVDPTSPVTNDEVPHGLAEPLDSVVAVEPSVEGVPIEVAMPAAEGALHPGPATPAEAPPTAATPARAPVLGSGFADRFGEDPHTTWSAVEVATGAPPPPPPPTAIAMPTPSLKATATRTPVPASIPPERAPGSWMPTPAPLLRPDAETEIRPRTDEPADPASSASHEGSPARPAEIPTLVARATDAWSSQPSSSETPADAHQRATPADDHAPAHTSTPPTHDLPHAPRAPASAGAPLATPAAAPVAVPPPLPTAFVPLRAPVEAKVELSPTEHGLPDIGSNVPMWLAAAFGLVVAVVFTAMMVAFVAWLG